jgi:UDP-2,4-diacetamido-2,4,6-trideoxy-beta-L-altropyranose hydrolase
MKLLIISDGSPEIGYGHLVRCITIAEYLFKKGWSCTILDPGFDILNVPFLKTKSFKKITYECLNKMIDYSNISNFDLTIIDGYNFSENFKSSLYNISKKIMIIDDLAKSKNVCDIILDQTPGRIINDYKNLVPKNCHILTGTKYIPLRSPILNGNILNNYKKRRFKKRKRKILISLGSTDPENTSIKVLKFLLTYNLNIEIRVITTKHFNNLLAMQKLLKLNKNKFKIFLNPTAEVLKKIYLDTDLSIGSCGIAIWERIYYRIPNVIYNPNEIQKDISDYLKEKNIVDEINSRKNILSFKALKKIKNLIKNDFFTSKLVLKAHNMINKKALTNIYNIINKVVNNEA